MGKVFFVFEMKNIWNRDLISLFILIIYSNIDKKKEFDSFIK